MPKFKTFSAAPAMLAALSLSVTPAMAAELPVRASAPVAAQAAPAMDIENSQTAEHYRYHRHRHRHYHRRGPSAGDVLAGVLIVGAVAAAANAAKRDRRDRDYRDTDYRDRDYRDERRDTRGIDRAVDMCVDAVDRERRVETVDRVDRTARGWTVEGTITRGDPFTCRIDQNGRGVDVDFPPRSARYDREDRDYDERYEDIDYREDRAADRDDNQWDDDRYASEWSRVDREGVETAEAAQPDYPGGPIEDAEAVDADLDIGDGYKGA